MFLRRKKKEEEEVNEGASKVKPKKVEKEDDGLVWDKKRLVIALVLVFVLVFGVDKLKNMFFPHTNILGESTIKKASEIEKPDVQGPNMDLQSHVTSSLQDVKDNINSINPEEVATSSPQIQKVLHDIQGIKNLPSDQARNACLKICSGI